MEPCDPCQTLEWIDVRVPTVICTLISGIWTPDIKMIDVKVLATGEGDEVAQTVNNYQEIAKANTELCLAKNKNEEEKECYAAIPDMWLIRPEHHRPQVIYQFAEVNNEGKIIGSAKYSITIPHHKPTPPDVSLPSYQKGNWELIYVLNDNSKIVIHAINKSESEKVFAAIIPLIIPKYLEGAYLSKSAEIHLSKPLQEIKVKNTRASYFENGRKNGKPEWIIKF